MKIVTLHEKTINIIYTIKEINMSLFLSDFFEACGIVSARYDVDYLPKKRIGSDYTIYIVEEERIDKLPFAKEEDILLVHAEKESSNCYSRIDMQNCEKILNYLLEKWDIPNFERDELSDLFKLYVKNDIWRMSWLVENVEHHREGSHISAGDQVQKYIEESVENMQQDLSNYKKNHLDNRIFHYFEHMQVYLLYRLYNIEPGSLKRFYKYSGLINNELLDLYYKNGVYLGYQCLKAKINMMYIPSYSRFDYQNLEKIYPQSEILYNMGYLLEIHDNELKQANLYYKKAYDANPTNYMPLFRAAINFFKEGDNLITISNFYNRIYKLLSRFELEEYTTQMDIRIRIAVPEQLLSIGLYSYPECITNLTALKQELENSKIFENIFVALASQNHRNLEIEEIAREKIKSLAKCQIEKHL